MIASTPSPPYYAVIFTSEQEGENEGYLNTANRMLELAKDQDGFLGVESAKEEIGITISYWRDTDCIRKWKMNAEHRIAQQKGKEEWYRNYKTRICLVERDYEFKK
jgi:heme-degrading monooxygenase HmoA